MSMNRGTMLDIIKLQNPDGTLAMVAEVLAQLCPQLQHGPMLATNATVGNRVTLRRSLPTVQAAQINKGTPRSKGSTRQQVDTCMFVDGRSEVDIRLAKIEGDAAVAAYRRGEDQSYEEAMAQFVSDKFLNGNELTNPDHFTGIKTRLSALTTAKEGSQVKSMGAVVGGDATSIYVCDWSPNWFHWIHPKHAPAGGLQVLNKGEQQVNDNDGNPFFAQVTMYEWQVGITVKDPRHLGRLANIDVSDALTPSPTQGNLLEALIDLEGAMPSPNGGQRVLYCSRNIYSAFLKQALNRFNAALSIQDFLGQLVPHFHGYPLHRVDAISEAESAVS